MVFTHICIQIAIIRLYLQILIYEYITHQKYYPREIWHYKQANTEIIRRAITDFNWNRAFLSTNAKEKVSIFSNTIMNILNNLIPHETIVCDDKDPAWFNKAIKSLNQRKKALSKNTAKAIAKSSYCSAKDFFKKN